FELLTFDCYGTLIDWEEGILRCLRRILAAHGKSEDAATILRLYADFEARAEQGEYRRYREVLESVVRQFGEQFGFSPTEQQAGWLSESLPNWKPWPDTVKALRELQSCFRLAIISNVDDDLFAATRSQLGAEFDQIVTAQQARAYKPSLKIFELALNRTGVPAHRVLHVGQSLYHDVVPAQSLGLATVWVSRLSARAGVGAVKAVEGQPDLQVSSLAELAACALS
ncbi:MAG: haloacid dehalogenase type II, partial [Candidatus Sulfotelmatobacter sp.]